MDALRNYFTRLNLVLIGTAAIRFKDAEVLRLLLTEKVYADFIGYGQSGDLRYIDTNSDGMIDYDEAGAVKSLSKRKDAYESIFTGNTVIERFNEFQYFTGIVNISGAFFKDCTNLREVTLPQSTIIGKEAFAHSGIEKVIIPEGCETLESLVCSSASNCKLIDIPSTVKSIGESLIWKLENVASIICRATTPPDFGGYGYKGVPVAVYVPDESVAAYKTAANWNAYAERIKPMSEM